MKRHLFLVICTAIALGACAEEQRGDSREMVLQSETCRAQAFDTSARTREANHAMTSAQTAAMYDKLYRDCLAANGYLQPPG